MIRKIIVLIIAIILGLFCFGACDCSSIKLGDDREIVYQNNLYNYYSFNELPTEYYYYTDDLITIGTLFWSYNCTTHEIGYSINDEDINILMSFYTTAAGDFWIKEGFIFPNYKEVELSSVTWKDNKNFYIFNNANKITFTDLIDCKLDEKVEGEDFKYIYLTLEEMPYLHIDVIFFILNGQGYLMVNESGEYLSGAYTYYLLKSEYLEIFESVCQF